MAIVSTTEVKRFMLPGMSVDDTTLSQLIDAVFSDMEINTGRWFNYDTYTEILSGGDYDRPRTFLFLKGVAVSKLNSIAINDIEQDVTEFSIDDNDIIRYVSTFPVYFPSGVNNIVIEYISGYGTGTGQTQAPAGLKQAIIDEVILRYEYYFSESRVGENIVDLKKTFLSSKVENILNKYKRISI